MSEPRFVHLRVHSDYSMIDGLAKTAPLVKKAAALGMPALAITDFTNLCGLVKFYGAGHGAGIKPIVGADFNVQCDLLGDELTHLTVLAANNTGYQNLTLLISKAYQRGYGAAGPIIDRDWLIELNEGLILLSGGRMGDVGRSLLRGNSALVDECVAFYEEHFPDRYFLELIRTGRPDEESYLHAAVELAEARGLPVVATNDVRFIDSSDFDAHEIRVAIHDGFTLDDPKRPRNYSPQQYMRSEEEMCELFADIPEALANTVEIAKRCNVTVRLGEYFLPQFPTGDMSTEDYLVKRAKEGLEERLAFLFPDEEERLKRRPEYDERLETELQVINQMGFPGYFLIVMEFIQWSKDNGVPVGPGRGSGAGSLVAYALKITDLDPLEFDLLFERFLNPERVSMPDFDVDFCMEKRDQVIEHVADMYGRDAVSQIITFGTMAAKAVIRDVGRVLGHPYGFVDRISKLIPPDPGMTLAKAFEAEPQLPEIYEADEEVKALIDMARKLEGVTRNAGKHAGGVVIAPTKITDFAPLYCDEEGKHPVTQFDKSDVEYAGLVKFVAGGKEAFMVKYNSMSQSGKYVAPGIDDPCPTVAVQSRLGVAKACFLAKHFSGSPADRAISIDGPAHAITTVDHHALVSGNFLTAYYGNGYNSPVEAPGPTVTTKDRFQLVQPRFLNMQYGNGGAVSVEEPAGTVTTTPKHHLVTCRLAIPARKGRYLLNPQYTSKCGSIETPCFTLIARMDKISPYIVTTEREGQQVAPFIRREGDTLIYEVYTTDSPIVVQIKEFMALYGLVDVKMRMLKIPELKRIMGFPANYKLVGTQAEQKKFIGNAVEVTMARVICEALGRMILDFENAA